MVVPGLGTLDADVGLALDGDPLDRQLLVEDRGELGGSVPSKRVSSVLDTFDVGAEVQGADTHQRVKFNLVIRVRAAVPRHAIRLSLNGSSRGRVLQPDSECSGDRNRQAVRLFVNTVTPERLGGAGRLLRAGILQLANEGDSDLT